MVKTKTSKKPKKSTGNTSKKAKIKPPTLSVKAPKKILKLKNEELLVEYSPTKELANEKFIAEAVWECMKNNDPEGVVEVVKAHLEAVNKLKAAKNIHLPRSTMYNALKSKNPTIGTLSKLIHCCL